MLKQFFGMVSLRKLSTWKNLRNLLRKEKREWYVYLRKLSTWNKKFNEFKKSEGFQQCTKDPCVYTKGTNVTDIFYILLNVNDMLVAGKDIEKVNSLKKRLNKMCEMKDLGPASRIF